MGRSILQDQLQTARKEAAVRDQLVDKLQEMGLSRAQALKAIAEESAAVKSFVSKDDGPPRAAAKSGSRQIVTEPDEQGVRRDSLGRVLPEPATKSRDAHGRVLPEPETAGRDGFGRRRG